MASIRRLNPPTLCDATALSFSQVAISHGQTLIHLAGQAALDRELNVVGVGDFARQLEVAFENRRLALAAAEAGPCDVVSLRIYVVGLDATCIAPLQHALESFFPDGGEPPSTLLGVAALAMPDLRVEIEAAAIR